MTKRKADTKSKEVKEPVDAAPVASKKAKAQKAEPVAEPKAKGKKAEVVAKVEKPVEKPAEPEVADEEKSEKPAEAAIKAVEALIDQIDFEPIRVRLEARYGWEAEHLDFAVRDYKRFLTMRKFFDEQVIASPEVDTVWAEHIIHTQPYLNDVTRIFGKFLHHVPIQPDEDLEAQQKLAERTAKLYTDFFDEEMIFLFDESDDEGCGHCEDSECDDSQCGEDDGEDGEDDGSDDEEKAE